MLSVDSSHVIGGLYLVLDLVLNLVLDLVLDKRPSPQEPGTGGRPSITWHASVTMTMGDGRLQVLSLHKATDRIQNPPSYLVPEVLVVATRRRSSDPGAVGVRPLRATTMSSQNGPAYRASMALMLLSAMAMLMMRSVAPTDAVTDAGEVRARSADLPSDCNQDKAIRPVLTPDLTSLQRVAVPNGVRVDVSLMPASNGMETSGKTGDARPSSFPLVVVRSGDGVSPRDTGVAVGRLLADETRSFVRDFIPSVTAKIEKLIRESKYEELTKIFPGWCVPFTCSTTNALVAPP